MWRVSADTGGTFTDCHAIAPDGRELRCKVLSTGALRARLVAVEKAGRLVLEDAWRMPDGFFAGFEALLPWCAGRPFRVVGSATGAAKDLVLDLDATPPESHAPGMMIELRTGEEAPILGARLLTRTPPGTALPPIAFRLATTRATNALLEKKGAPVAFIVTRGFRDLLAIGDQRRADLFALRHEVRTQFHREAREVNERMSASGAVLEPLDERELAAIADELLALGIRHAAVAFLHSQANGAHEQMAGRVLRERGFAHVSLSSEIAPFTKILPRAQSAVANAYLTAPVESFLNRVAVPLRSAFHILTSGGGLETRAAIRPKDLLLSGPAAGVIGAVNAAAQVGCGRVISFDMGGTSTDVARIDGRPGYRFTQQVAGLSLLAPCVAIETVAAGGGSICDWGASGLVVGPHSAGSDPGPACYGKGGPLTITDVNLLLGRFDPARAPIPLDPGAASRRLAELGEKIRIATGQRVNERELLESCLRLAVERMADAIRLVSVAEGCDPADYTLLAFGGAGPQHACDLADQLGIRTILVPRNAGLLSAAGLQEALPERFAERQVLQPVADVRDSLPSLIASLAAEARNALAAQGIPETECDAPHVLAELRLKGQDVPLQITLGDPAEIIPDYRTAYQRMFGYQPAADRVIELVSLRVAVRARGAALPQATDAAPASTAARHEGPALVQDEFSTLVIAPGWSAEEIAGFGWRLAATGNQRSHATLADSAFARDLFRHRLDAIVAEMGALLRRTAISTNIRERLDFSCALLDPQGRLVTSAPHIPVHLGALGVCVRKSMEHGGWRMKKGDTFITNHPAFGGSHLPDITLITPVFDDGGALLGFVANRAHHAEIGGITPGSMPANATRLIEEGAVIAPQHLMRAGESCFAEIEKLFTSGPHPTRNLGDNLADLHAQLAANLLGVERFQSLAADDSERARQLMAGILDDSARTMRAHLEKIDDCEAAEQLDDGSVIQVSFRRLQSQRSSPQAPCLALDFTGTAPVHRGNLNATAAIVQSAVLYVLRLMLREDLPLNEGLLAPVELILPPSLLNPVFTGDAATDPAVVGGNVEVSQRLVDTLTKALRLQACSQGTMNNLLFGNARFGYYETIAGGAGAGEGYAGASALHTHMTNTAITDPEIIEQRHPVRLREFSIRHGSGGAGKWRGGDGVVREFEFLESLTLSLLTQHRTTGPFGMNGGGCGQPGRQLLISKNGERPLPPSCSLPVQPGDRLRVETPGGGGWG